MYSELAFPLLATVLCLPIACSDPTTSQRGNEERASAIPHVDHVSRNQVEQQRRNEMAIRTKTADLAELKITLPDELLFDEGWPMKVTLTNTGAKHITVYVWMGDCHDVQLVVRDSRGKQLKMTKYGRQHYCGEGGLYTTVSGYLSKIERDGDYTWEIELGKSFTFQPGTYTLAATVRAQIVEDGGTVTNGPLTRTVRFEVIEK